MEELGFVKSETVGNTRIYFARKEFKFAKLLTELLTDDDSEILHSPNVIGLRSEDIALNMSFYGAPLGQSGKPKVQLSLEETVSHALHLAHKNPTVARALPVLLYFNKDRLDLQLLRFHAERLNEKQALGFFLDLTASLSNYQKYEYFAKKLFDKRFKKNKNFFSQIQGKFGEQLTKKNTPAVAKKWKYLINMELSTFQSLFDKFVDMSS